jgi:hypothetical protein
MSQPALHGSELLANLFLSLCARGKSYVRGLEQLSVKACILLSPGVSSKVLPIVQGYCFLLRADLDSYGPSTLSMQESKLTPCTLCTSYHCSKPQAKYKMLQIQDIPTVIQGQIWS